jgi:hypothetical protein
MHVSILERRKMKAAALALALTAPIAGFEGMTNAAVINTGDIIVDQVGNGASALANTGTAVSLVIYTPTVSANGSVVLSAETSVPGGTIALPTAASVNGLASNPLVQSGTASSEGEITISPDGSAIVVAGYAAPVGAGANGVVGNTSSIAGSNSTVVNRVFGLVYTANGTVDTSTTTTAFNSNNPRSGVLYNGTIYAGGATSPGITALTVDANATVNGAGTQLQNTVTNFRQLEVFNGTLYASDSSGNALRLASITGFNGTANSATAAELAGLSANNAATPTGTEVFAPYGFAFAEGGSTLYIADQGSNGNNGAGTGVIEKFVLSNGTYTADGSVAAFNTITGLTTEQLTGTNGTFDAVFATTPTGIYEISDTGGSLSSDTLNLAVSAPTNDAFRGITADAPPSAVPEPALLSSLLIAGIAGLGRRNPRRASHAK